MAAQPKTALITGSTSGIGLGIAKALAARGYTIMFNGLEPDGADIAAGVAKEHNIQYRFSAANLMEESGVDALAAEALQAFGRVDVLVNNAGIQHVSPIATFPPEKYAAIIALNLNTAFYLTRLIWPGMAEAGWGRVVNIASAHGLVASAFKSAYVASKHGIVGLTKALALEGAEHGITVNAVCPGYVHTPIIDKQIADQMAAHNMTRDEVINKVMLDKQAIKSFIPIEAIAHAVLYLCDDLAATTTGIALPIDGGWTAE